MMGDDVTVATLVSEFDRCAPWLEAAIVRGGAAQSLEDVFYGVTTGAMQFWPGHRSAMVTELHHHPNGSIECFVLLGGGDIAELEVMLRDVERFAAANSATVVSVLGRRGWERTFLTRRAGYEPTATLYVKTLESAE